MKTFTMWTTWNTSGIDVKADRFTIEDEGTLVLYRWGGMKYQAIQAVAPGSWICIEEKVSK